MFTAMNVAHATFYSQRQVEAGVIKLYNEFYEHRQTGTNKSLSIWLGLVAETVGVMNDLARDFAKEENTEDDQGNFEVMHLIANNTEQRQQTRAKSAGQIEKRDLDQPARIVMAATCVLAVCCLWLRFCKGRNVKTAA